MTLLRRLLLGLAKLGAAAGPDASGDPPAGT
jgi:hypothetical protein